METNMPDQTVRALTILHHLVWTILGILILIAIVAWYTGHPLRALGAFNLNLPIPTQAPAPSRAVGRINNLTTAEQACIEDAIGTQRFNDIKAGTTRPTAQDRQALQDCR